MPDWKNLPPLFPRDVLHPAVVAAAERAREPWCVAFSGGADSLALLLLIRAHWPSQRGKLTALHFNHRLRGADSDGDEQFCRDVCASLGIPIKTATWEHAHAGAGEAEAREARQAFFVGEMKQLDARVLWTGHQQDDIAETQLMRLARGSSSAGLSAPRPVQELNDGRILLRPLLTLSKAAITQGLKAAGVIWREDASNQTRDFFRNRVRSEVMPHWLAAAENDALAGAALSRELLAEDDAALEAWLAELPVKMSGDFIDLRVLAGKPRALLRRILRRWPPAAALARQGFEELIALAEHGSGQISIGQGCATGEDGIWRWKASTIKSEPWVQAHVIEGISILLPDGAEFRVNRVQLERARLAQILSGGVDPAREAYVANFDAEFTIRNWRPGDRYRPLGAPGSSKLQDMFSNRKLPLERRVALPVICASAGRIIWVPGFSPADEWKLTDTSVTGVHLTYHTGTSTVHPSPNP